MERDSSQLTDEGPLLRADELFRIIRLSSVVRLRIWPLLDIWQAFHRRELLLAEELSFILEDQSKCICIATNFTVTMVHFTVIVCLNNSIINMQPQRDIAHANYARDMGGMAKGTNAVVLRMREKLPDPKIRAGIKGMRCTSQWRT